jgi:hypothetical protein
MRVMITRISRRAWFMDGQVDRDFVMVRDLLGERASQRHTTFRSELMREVHLNLPRHAGVLTGFRVLHGVP